MVAGLGNLSVTGICCHGNTFTIINIYGVFILCSIVYKDMDASHYYDFQAMLILD